MVRHMEVVVGLGIGRTSVPEDRMIAMEGCSEERKGLQVVDCKRDGLYHSVGRSSVEPIQCILLAGYYAKSSQSRRLAIDGQLSIFRTTAPEHTDPEPPLA